MPELGDRLHELYGLPLDEFTAARNALAKELARAGEKQAAAEVKKLPKPNKTAGVLNQLARRQPDAVATLLETGDELRDAQEQALRGDASRLRTASRAEQAVVEELVEATAAIDPTVDQERVRRTLRAAAADASVGRLLREGRLLADAETSGFGLDAFADTVLTTPARAGRRTTKAAPAAPAAPARKRDDADDEAARRAAHEARERAQREARREAERLAKEAAVEANRAQRRRDEADRAEAQAREARRKADEATARAEDAQQRAEDAARRAGTLD